MSKIKLGDQIRYFRKANNLSQETLAEGICSVSYLSKIENNVTIPSDDITQFLLKKLNLELDMDRLNTEEEVKKSLYKWYEHMFKRQENIAIEMYKELNTLNLVNAEIRLLKYLFEFFYLTNKKELNKATVLLTELENTSDLITGKNQYYYNKFKGVYYYLKNKPHEGLKHLIMAKNMNRFDLNQWDKGYLYYLLGLVSCRLYRNKDCIDHINYALEIFEKNYIFNRCADCKILLGIAYQRIGEFNKAKEEYNLAMGLVDSFNNHKLKGKVFHNLGHLESLKGNSLLAIDYFEKSLQFFDRNEKAATIFILIEETYKTKQLEQCKQWVEYGLEVIGDSPDALKDYSIHFKAYELIVIKGLMDNETLNYLKNIVVPYFLKLEIWVHVIEYSEVLAKTYEALNKYKSSSYYYALANKGLKILSNFKGGDTK